MIELKVTKEELKIIREALQRDSDRIFAIMRACCDFSDASKHWRNELEKVEHLEYKIESSYYGVE